MKWWEQMPWSSFFECGVLSQLFYSPLSPSSRGSLVPLCSLPSGCCHLNFWGCGKGNFLIVLVFCFKFKNCFLHVYHKEFIWSIYLWPRSCHKWGDLNSRRIQPHSSGGQESEIKVWPGLVLSEALVCPLPSSPCVSLHLLPFVCILPFSFSSCGVIFCKVNSHIGWGVHPTQV